MKLFRGGEAVELSMEGTISALSDRVVVRTAEGSFTGVAVTHGDDVFISFRGRTFRFQRKAERTGAIAVEGSGEIRAKMPGLIVEVNIAVNDIVKKGTRLVVLEAMKTQQPMLAPFDGTVTAVRALANQQVQEGDLLVKVEKMRDDA